MKINVETSVIDPKMIKKLLEIEAMTSAEITINIREIVTYGNSSPLICGSCHEHHYPDQPCHPRKETS